jgi:pimeloyl-ACP methyl ester carboxylesterase
MTSNKPTIIIIHGGWHSPEHYALLASNVESHGYETKSVWLPSMHWKRHNLHPAKINPLTEDIRITKDAIVQELDAHPDVDVVLVGHSSGTVIAGAAIEDLDKITRAKQGKSNGVAVFAIIAGILCTAGITTLDWAGGVTPPTVKVSKMPHPDFQDDETKAIEVSGPVPDPGPVALFYHDMEDQVEAKRYADLCTPQLFAVNRFPVPFAAWALPTLPVHYLVTEEDHAIPAAFQRIMIQGADDVRTKAASSTGGSQNDKTATSGNLLDKFMTENLASLASVDRVQAASENLLQQHGATSRSGQNNSTGQSDDVKVQVTSMQASHSPFLSKVEETGLWLRRACGEKV